MSQTKSQTTAEGFVGSIFKYSISTFANLGIQAITMLITGFFIPAAVLGQVSIFTQWTNTLMTIAILGLDQALIRFYNEPPAGLSKNGLFRICFYFSSGLLLVGGTIATTLFMRPIYDTLGFSMVGTYVVPMLFLNAFFYMIARYFNVLYRMEGNIKVYTIESILMQFFYRLFLLLGAFLGFSNPVPAMVLCSLLGLGAFALVFSFMRRKVLAPKPPEFAAGGYKSTLPYGIAIAPTAIFITLNYSFSLSYLTSQLGEGAAGIYGMGYMLSNVVAMVQLGFASFWGPYMFAHYKTEQARIRRVHDYINFIILAFFTLLVAFEDIIFWMFGMYADVQPIFPLMMLSAVFTILCETTVYGNYIAKKPIFDTMGIALSFGCNLLLLVLTVPTFGLHGAALALAAANFAMFLFRTLTAQRFYKSINSPARTATALVIASLLTLAGTMFAGQFLLKLAACAAALVIYCLMYRPQMIRLINLGLSILGKLFSRRRV